MHGQDLHDAIRALYPITRSIAGPGVRETLERLGAIVPLELRGVASGTPLLDWTAPKEWTLREAYIENARGERVLDSRHSNLHVVNFSTAVDTTLDRASLEPHLHSLPDRPDAVPYRTGYYDENWGFCLSHRARERLGDGPFRVVIDATRTDGVMNWGECIVPGSGPREILISTHLCHPSLANDNLSGLVLAAAWAAERRRTPSAFTWRFVFVPGTIGAIGWLDRHRDAMPAVAGGLVITGLGDRSRFHWKRTAGAFSDGPHWIDRLVEAELAARHPDHHAVLPFGPYGYDERQYGSPGFRLPMGRLTRGVHGTFPQYHTSDDDLTFVTPDGLEQSLALLRGIGQAIDADRVYRNRQPYGEPQLGRRGLYGALGALPAPGDAQMAMLWLLNRADGTRGISEIAWESGLAPEALARTARLLVEHELLEELGHASEPRAGA